MLGQKISTTALLVHHHTETGQVDVTHHEVKHRGDGFSLAAGGVMTTGHVRELTEVLLGTSSQSALTLLPDNLLAQSDGTVVWYQPPRVAEMAILGTKDKVIRLKHVPYPGHIFVAHTGKEKGFAAFAFKGKRRPDADTALFYSPTFNVYRDGSICMGSVGYAKGTALECVPHYERFFYDAVNTHAGSVTPVRSARDTEALIAFWRKLQRDKARSFPSRQLMEAPSSTLRELLGRLSR